MLPAPPSFPAIFCSPSAFTACFLYKSYAFPPAGAQRSFCGRDEAEKPSCRNRAVAPLQPPRWLARQLHTTIQCQGTACLEEQQSQAKDPSPGSTPEKSDVGRPGRLQISQNFSAQREARLLVQFQDWLNSGDWLSTITHLFPLTKSPLFIPSAIFLILKALFSHC